MRPNPETKSREGHLPVLSVLHICTENKEKTAEEKCSWYLVWKKRNNRYVGRNSQSNRNCKYVSVLDARIKRAKMRKVE